MLLPLALIQCAQGAPTDSGQQQQDQQEPQEQEQRQEHAQQQLEQEPQPHQQEQQQQQQQPQQEQESQGEQQGDAARQNPPAGRRYSVAAILRSIKLEPGTGGAAAAGAAVGAGDGGGVGSSGGGESSAAVAFPGPQTLALLQQAVAAGLGFPDKQQMDYFLLADDPFDGGQLLELFTAHLAPQLVTRSVGRTNRSGAVREAVMTVPLGHSRVQHVYSSLAPGFEQLTAALPEQQHLLLLQQQQQPPAQKKRKLNNGSASAAAAAAIEPTDAARRLLVALRCLLFWEGRRLQEQQLPLLLQLLLFGGPTPVAEGVVECVDLVSDEEDESLNRQLMQGEDELLIAKEVQPRGQQASSREGEGGGGSRGGLGRVRVKREPGGDS